MSCEVGGDKIFIANDDYSRFLSYLEKAVAKFEIDIFGFVLMSNHYHLLLRINKPKHFQSYPMDTDIPQHLLQSQTQSLWPSFSGKI
ncbi:MAG: hypothetical protein ACUZ8H_03945 [Candidatus Anammoxibacter sp.]